MTDSSPSAATDVLSTEKPDWLVRGFGLAFLLGCAVALSPSAVDPDLWGHVQYGEELLAERVVPETSTHTFTAIGHRWINHENVSELVFALGYRFLGARGLLLAKCLLGLGVVGLMIGQARRRGVSFAVTCGVMLLVATSLTAFWPMRPQLLSYALFALLMALVCRAFRDWHASHTAEVRWLWLVPPLFVLWANSHGAFAAGLCIFAAYLGGRSLEAVYHRGRDGWWTALQLNLVLLASGFATLLNPYGTELLAWLVESLKNPRPEITEWASPAPSDPFFFSFVVLAVIAAVAFAATKRRRDWIHLALLTLTLWQAAMHLRHIAFFALLCGFWLPEHVESVLGRLRSSDARRDEPVAPWMRRILLGGLSLTFVLLGCKLYERLHDFPVKRDTYPVAALQYMTDHQLHGKLVVAFNWAQYAIAAIQPETQVAFDGRFRTCYPQEVVDMHFDFLIGEAQGRRYRSEASGPVDPTRALRFQQPDLVLIDRAFKHSTRVMAAQDDWVLLYQDSLAQLWGRQERYDEPSSPKYLPVNLRSISDALQLGSVTWPALPVRQTKASPSTKSPMNESSVTKSPVNERRERS